VTLGINEDIHTPARPAEAEDRAVPGHWEGETADLARIEPGRDYRDAPLSLRKSITWDRGNEMAQHAQFKTEARLQIYLCDPQSPWQRGTNENTNGLLRQYWPNGAALRSLTQIDCDHVALNLNTRPRRTLEWKTPGQALNTRLVAPTAPAQPAQGDPVEPRTFRRSPPLAACRDGCALGPPAA